ncbi:MAG: oxidative damage protection protein [Legionellales bacterium]|nr:oxidative damage protection protein [Legionellales bacterium]
MVQCVKLKRKAPALAYPPLPGAMGQRLMQQISQPAWDAWMQMQTKWINELRLNPTDPKAQQLLHDKMCEFLFDEMHSDSNET